MTFDIDARLQMNFDIKILFVRMMTMSKKCSFLHCVQGGLCIIEVVAVGSTYDGISKFIFRKVYFYGDK